MRLPRRFPQLLVTCAVAVLTLVAAPSALGAPLPGSAYDTGDGNQDNALGLDWQGAQGAGAVKESPDANDDCFIGGVKELSPNAWAFNTSAGGCTPGKSNLRVAFANPESTDATTFTHFAFFRNDTTGNTFLTFELNQAATSWTNAKDTTIPCRSSGDLLLSFEVGGSSLTTTVYKWAGDGSGPPSCPDGASGTFISSGTVPPSRFQGAMNAAAAIANYVRPGAYGASFPGNSFGEAAIDLPAVLQNMGQSPCFGFVRMQVHSRSSSSISSAMIDYTTPVPVFVQSCSVTGTQYQDTDGDGTRDAGEPGVAGFEVFADVNNDGDLDPGEPSGTSDATGFYRILGVTAGSYHIREVPRTGWRCSQPSPCFYSRSIVTGGNSTGNDFGNVAPSTASGTTFDDLDGDGLRDAGEPGLADVSFYVDVNDDGVRDDGEPSGTSTADGTWTIDDVPGGTYKIREMAASGWSCSAPSPCYLIRTFSSGSSAANLTFGNFADATLAGNAFEDVNGDGAAKAAGDSVLADAQVYLDANGNDAFDLGERQTLTDGAGDYSFTALAPGTYTARVTSPSASWYCTRPSLASAACERALTLTSGQVASGQSFGQARFATVSGTNFEDANSNGVKDAGEGALLGFTFWVDYDDDNSPDVGEPSATSDAAGNWALQGVHAGSWTLREVPNGAWACTKPSSPCTYPLTLTSNATATGFEFGNFTSRSVSGVVFNDANANGVNREAGEAGLGGWVVYYDSDKDSVRDATEPTSTTNSLGQYNLTGIANGNYEIRIIGQAGWTCSYPSGCLNGGSVGQGASDVNKNFGVWGPSSIAGTVYEDADGDGAAKETGENGVSGRVVYVDMNNNGSKDGVEPSGTSADSGDYTISGVNPGVHVVRQVLPADWTCSRPAPCSYSVTISAANAGGRDFASHTTGLISGVVYDDADADATRDAEEAGILSRTVYLDTNGDGVKDLGEASTTTNSAGAYTFAGLAPGAYKVRQVLPTGWTQSAPAVVQTVIVASQAAVTATSLGSYAGATISGTFFEDKNFDASAYQSGDTLLSGRSVYLDLDGDGAQDGDEPSLTTDELGIFEFGGLVPGTYTVRAATPADWACAHPAECSHTVTVVSGATSSGNDFGSYLGASVSGSVFEDADADGGAREADESGLAGRRVYLDADADLTRDPSEPTTVTDESGNFAFSGILARSWTVRLEAEAGWSCDRPSPCHTDVSLTSGSSSSAVDFGTHTTASVSGHLFTDRDNNGQPQVFGENDQPGRTVYADANDNQERDAGEATATTDERGDYTLNGVAPGTYDVRQILPDGWSCSTPSPCTRPVTLASRQALTGRDFSSWTRASFSGTYFEDSAGDGDFPEPGDDAIAGRTVYVDIDGDGEPGALEPSAITDADGAYRLKELTPGTYVVRVEAQPDGWTCSYPSTCSQALSLEAGEAAQDVSFGAWTTGTVAGVAYEDTDADSSRGVDEPGLANQTIYADLDDDGVKDPGEPFMTTGASGAFQLTLDPGTHRLRELSASGWGCTAPAPCVRTVTVSSQGTLTDEDFGNRTSTGDVAGTVYEDVNADRARAAGDGGRPGVTVYVDTDGSGSHGGVEPVDVTDADGTYRFVALPVGEHTIRIEMPSGWLCAAAPCVQTVTIRTDDDLAGYDFGVAQPATIAGDAFEDSNGDGSARESGDGDVAGWEISLDGTDEPHATTGSGGAYSFAGLPPGTYTVRALDRTGWSCSYPATCTWTVVVNSGELSDPKNFGATRQTTVTGAVFEDRAADATRDVDDGGREGVDVWVDYDDNGGIDPGEPQAATDADGDYTIADVRIGTSQLRVATTGGWSCSAPVDCAATISPTSGQTVIKDFATWKPARISGELYDDADGDGGARVAGDGSLSDTVTLARDGTTVKTAAGSAVTGGYELTAVKPGTYTLAADLTGRICTRPVGCGRTITVVSGEPRGGQDFSGYVAATASGTVHDDGNGDGVVDPDEPGAALGVVWSDLNGDGIRDAVEPYDTVAADGTWTITGLAPGTHAFVLAPASSAACANAGACAETRVLSSGGAGAGIDLAAYRPASIAGTVSGPSGPTVYLDTDGDGARGAGEPTAPTGVGGAYAFAGLAPGAYAVRLDLPDGYVCSAPSDCRHTTDIESGDASTANDFTVYRVAGLYGTVFEDSDASGAVDTGEPGLQGVTVYLDLDTDDQRDGAEPTTTTDGDGEYAFAGLAPGPYAVRLDPGAALTCSVPAVCVHTRTLASGQAASALDFAVWRAADVTGTVFNDLDGDGSRSAGEPARADVQVFLDGDDDGQLDSGEPAAVSAADGHYDLEEIRPGVQALRVQAPTDWTCTWAANCRVAITASSGRSTTVAELGLHKITSPAAAEVSSSGAGGASQSWTLVVPPGGSVTLLDDGGQPTLLLIVAGEGEYVLDPVSGVVTFTPLAGFTGAARPVRYRITDADGATAEGTYSPTVQPRKPLAAPVVTPAPARAPAQKPAPAPTSRPCLSRRALTIHWKVPPGTVMRRLTITLNGRVYARLPGRARSAVIDLKGRPPQKVVLRISGVSSRAVGYSAGRTYRTCRRLLKHPALPTLRLTPSANKR